ACCGNRGAIISGHGLRRDPQIPFSSTLPAFQVSPAAYCPSLYRYQRRLSRVVNVGAVAVGGSHPIRVQSMITCDTMDTAASIQQTLDLVAVGCEIVRITAPTVKDA